MFFPVLGFLNRHNNPMEEWHDQGIVLKARSHGENGAVVTVLTEKQGRHAGYIRHGQSKSMRPVIEPGSIVSARWNARTSDDLGSFALEQEKYPAAAFMHDPMRLSALLSAASLCDAALPEREVHSGMYHGMLALLDALEGDIWQVSYVLWEIAFIRELGFGLNLSHCVSTGQEHDLAYVSPKSGQAVSKQAGEPYKDKLLSLPSFLSPERGEPQNEDILDALSLTFYFLQHRIFADSRKGVPEERNAFQQRFIANMDKAVE